VSGVPLGESVRCCLLSGGESRRMGRDKALLPHPDGGTWLEHSLRLATSTSLPVTLCSRHASHQHLAERLGPRLGVPVEVLREPPPWEGPLRALGRMLESHPGETLLICPVDMPWLTSTALLELLTASSAKPGRLHAAHDGTRLQPLLSVVPADGDHSRSLITALGSGERSLHRWMAQVGYEAVPLSPSVLRNANHPDDLADLARGGEALQ
jgi:molybdopterin-guanine dinucleotide biosynthesis protein A